MNTMPYIACSDCNQTFTRKQNLKRHLQLCHTREKPFACSFCKTSFSRNHLLKNHLRSDHAREKPFACSRCNVSFSHYHHLKRHQISFHSGERPFACSFCKKTFTRKDALTRHLNTCRKRDSTVLSAQKEEGHANELAQSEQAFDEAPAAIQVASQQDSVRRLQLNLPPSTVGSPQPSPGQIKHINTTILPHGHANEFAQTEQPLVETPADIEVAPRRDWLSLVMNPVPQSML